MRLSMTAVGVGVAGALALGGAVSAQNVPSEFVVSGKAAERIQDFTTINLATAERISEACEKLAAELDMNDFLDRRCDKFSTGMKQKTSIARTLVHDPDVMIFDEPTLGLDVMTARAIVKFVRQCRDRVKTVIYSSHVMSEIEKLCDRIGIIHDGKLVAVDARTGAVKIRSAAVDESLVYDVDPDTGDLAYIEGTNVHWVHAADGRDEQLEPR